MIPRRRRRADGPAPELEGPREHRATWRATGLRILAFKQAPPGTTSKEFNSRPSA